MGLASWKKQIPPSSSHNCHVTIPEPEIGFRGLGFKVLGSGFRFYTSHYLE